VTEKYALIEVLFFSPSQEPVECLPEKIKDKEGKSMARAKKEYRELTVSEATNYGRKTAPMLRIQGLWFQELGFNIGDPVLVKCEEGKLIIMADTAMAELKKAEQAFMEEETKKLQARFQKEKKELRAKFVAEKKADYCMVAEAGLEA
jgi:hypothetical protein